jgi:hypothetical protein
MLQSTSAYYCTSLCISTPLLRGACDITGWGNLTIIQSDSGQVTNQPFHSQVEGYSEVWVALSETAASFAPIDITISSGGRVLCSSTLATPEHRRPLLFTASLTGGYAEFRISVNATGQNAAQLPVKVYSLVASLQGTWTVSSNGRYGKKVAVHQDKALKLRAGKFLETGLDNPLLLHGKMVKANQIEMRDDRNCPSPCVGTVSADARQIAWSSGVVWTKFH